MPELPEVEVTRRGLEKPLQGAQIQRIGLGKPLRWPLGIAASALVGRTVQAVRRRGKYIVLVLDEGVLLIHLGMSGSLRFATQLPPQGAHDHFEMATDQGVLRLHDPRRFGAVVWAPDLVQGMAAKLLSTLGMEPLEESFGFVQFFAALKRSRMAIKPLLLAGRVVVGVGNIYASEVLFLAGIKPTKAANTITRPQAQRLQAAIQQVLTAAIAVGGASMRDFLHVDGYAGAFQMQANVYGRAGEPCKQCATPIRLVRQGQRSTYFCQCCQK